MTAQDTTSPVATLESPSDVLMVLPMTLPLDVRFTVEDASGLAETIVDVAIAGCTVFEGPVGSGAVQLLLAKRCRVASGSGIDVLIQPRFSVVAADCNSNRSAPATTTMFRRSLRVSSLSAPEPGLRSSGAPCVRAS
jgi:hypothetical protein